MNGVIVSSIMGTRYVISSRTRVFNALAKDLKLNFEPRNKEDKDN